MPEKAILLMRLEGPMQAWGGASKWVVRDTDDTPTLSGVVGMICAAMGRRRDEPLDEFACADMAARADRQGMVMRDYHTVGAKIGCITAERKVKHTASTGQIETLVSERYYLCDASFLVALLARAELVEKWAAALRDPVWSVYLGRKSCPPSVPVFESVAELPRKARRGKGNLSDALLDVLKSRRWGPRLKSIDRKPGDLRVQLPADTKEPGAYPRPDVPLSFRYRTFDVRYVRDIHVPVEEFGVGEESQRWIGPARINPYGKGWPERSREYRRSQKHICEFCGLPAEHTHHLVYDDADKLHDENLRALCRLCHDAVTMLEAERDVRPHGIDPLSEAFRDLVLERRERLLDERFKRDFRERRLEDVLRVISQR